MYSLLEWFLVELHVHTHTHIVELSEWEYFYVCTYNFKMSAYIVIMCVCDINVWILYTNIMYPEYRHIIKYLKNSKVSVVKRDIKLKIYKQLEIVSMNCL